MHTTTTTTFTKIGVPPADAGENKVSPFRPRHQGGAHGGRAPAKIVMAPFKNNWTNHVPYGLPDKFFFGILGHFLYLKKVEKDQMATLYIPRLSHTHSHPACHAPEMHCIST